MAETVTESSFDPANGIERIIPGPPGWRWIDNSEDVAKLHYLQVTDQHFEKAVFSALQNPVQTLHEQAHQESLAVNTSKSHNAYNRGVANGGELLQCTKIGPEGLEPTTNKL